MRRVTKFTMASDLLFCRTGRDSNPPPRPWCRRWLCRALELKVRISMGPIAGSILSRHEQRDARNGRTDSELMAAVEGGRGASVHQFFEHVRTV
jgi:hypothetical protein